MSLTILDENQSSITLPLRTYHNGFTGGYDSFKLYIINFHNEFYYKDITLKVEMTNLEEGALFSTDGWSVKLNTSSTEPTEKQWGNTLVNNQVSISDIGGASGADVVTAYPVWVRVFCPGNSLPDIKSDLKIKLKYTKKVV